MQQMANLSTIQAIGSRTGERGIEHEFGDSRLWLLSPGAIEGRFKCTSTVLIVKLAPANATISVNSDKRVDAYQPADSMAICPPGTETYSRVRNFLPSLVMEVGQNTLENWMADCALPPSAFDKFLNFEHDSIAASATRALIELSLLPQHQSTSRMESTQDALISIISNRFYNRIEDSFVQDNSSSHEWSWHSRFSNDRLNPAIQLVENRLEDHSLKISDLASAVGVSPAHFAPLFKNYFGCTPYSYIRKRRIDRALQLIQSTKTSLAQIATLSGFSDQSHMTSVFSKELGVTPHRIREQRRKGS